MNARREPSLEMLWEQADARQILRRRFGFSDASAAAAWVREVLDAHWGLGVVSVDRIVMSDRNALVWFTTAHDDRIAKWCADAKQTEFLGRLARLTNWLGEQGVPVSAPVPGRDGQLQADTTRGPMSVQRVVQGSHLDVRDLAQVRSAGSTLAKLNKALDHPDAWPFPVTGDHAPLPLRERMLTWADSSPAHAPQAMLNDLSRAALAAPEPEFAVQPVHGDYRAANLICGADGVRAVLDFEQLRRDHAVVELARSATLIGTVFHDWAPVSETVRAEFIAGYLEAAPVSESEVEWLDTLMAWSSLALATSGGDPEPWIESAAGILARSSK